MPDIDIIYEDSNILAINKPSGISVHGDGKSDSVTVADWILAKYPEISTVGEPLILPNDIVIPRPGIVHRLDKDTSGVLVIAKNRDAYLYLKRQFKEHTVKKTYRAFVWGIIKDDRLFIDRAIERSVGDFRRFTSTGNGRGEKRDAQTRVRIIKRLENATYIEAMPITGRTHQIRVHMAFIGHPVIGDNLYGKDKPDTLGFGRMALHAHTITIKLPQGSEIKIEAPLPQVFLKAV